KGRLESELHRLGNPFCQRDLSPRGSRQAVCCATRPDWRLALDFSFSNTQLHFLYRSQSAL
ncbi:hypothetical protein, partial [Sphingobium yanoikuyae]|uniref:hypothetical protein n=1 Tax=Sphingobium yanoikuyae TaxID=13690 RepID=UPI00242A7C78